MKRATPTRQEIAKQLIAQHHKEQEVERIRENIDAARAADAVRPRLGPKDPVYLPYKENNEFY